MASDWQPPARDRPAPPAGRPASSVSLCTALSMGLMIAAHLGLDPWDVFHQGIARQTGLSFGTVVIVVGALVLLLWIPLRQRPGSARSATSS